MDCGRLARVGGLPARRRIDHGFEKRPGPDARSRPAMDVNQELQRAIEESRARIRIGFPMWLRPFVMRGVVAITIGRRIYVNASIARESFERLLRHELVHVRQIDEIGFFRFYFRYGLEYLRNVRAGMKSYEAYRNVSFEREAFLAEEVHTNLDV